ncbi:MAG: 7,8-dihydroneopterin aldolase/epimerase/oxygenase [Campylobacterota bacterium]|nr:7,8-dihydroneopterin aldolase/epimerase/oxygenase [Campylobacterota bacterium]
MKIFINKLQFNAIMGILEFERDYEQKIQVDCELDYDGEFIDYSLIRELIKKNIIEKKFRLIEDALVFLAEEIKKSFSSAKKIKLAIYKPDIFNDCVVGAEITKEF